ncbi:MAG: hypothetical protein PVF52_05070 [Granulosicoccaceae bacterium]|jgi:hypothetical protein
MPTPPTASLSRYWLIFSMQAVFIPIIAIVIVLSGIADVRMPALGQYLLLASMPLIAFAAWLTQRYREAQSELIRRSNISNDAIAQLRRKMVLAISIADMPATLAMMYLLFTGDFSLFAVLCISSFVLLYFLKPEPAIADR